MASIKRYEWLLLVVLALAGVLLWRHYAFPRYETIDLAVKQHEAVAIARQFLVGRGVNAGDYMTGCIFNVDDVVDRYLQKTLGIAGSKQWLAETGYDLFFWTVRFFRENTKEEYSVAVSAKTGTVIRFTHDLDATAARPDLGKAASQTLAWDFLQHNFNLEPDQYIPHSDSTSKLDHRMDYTFTWEDKRVAIPWDEDLGGGSAKLVPSAVISGDEVSAFNRGDLEIPEGFNRYTDSLKQTGQNLILVFRIIYLALLTVAIMLLVNRKQHVIPRLVRPVYVWGAALLFVFMVLDFFNSYQRVLFGYPTTQSFGNYYLRQLIEAMVSPFFIVVSLVLPALSGEALRFEAAPRNKTAGFLSAVQSSFFTRSTARQILVGYMAALFVMGTQALIFHMGYRFCGVWDEFTWLSSSSARVFPAFAALLIGFHASFSEEIMFRLFAINMLRRYGLPVALAVFLSAVMWGFGHTGYAIYPMWFRGVEVTALGVVLGIFYLRYGLITTLVAHYLMDAFFYLMPYLLKINSVVDFCVSLGVLAIPLVMALVCFLLRKPEEERPMATKFTPQQEFNYILLRELKCGKITRDQAQLKKDLLRHGWDPAVVERAFDN